MRVTLRSDSLTLEAILIAGKEGPVPVSFGFHPYFRIQGLPRSQWRLSLPAMRRLITDRNGIPTGEEEPFNTFDSQMEEIPFDDGFAVLQDRPSFVLSGAGYRLTVEFLSGFRYVQVFAPKDKAYVALEPMTAPTNALVSGRGLTIVGPGKEHRATFRIEVMDAARRK